ncbi:MAG TPA: hypothetical protein VH089_22165 [Streptosporangiaceae bacterium]|nr:hypothetical protein [Streptosporangiaceae bacterium]
MRDNPAVVALVAAAGEGDQDAWNELVERYAPLVWSICRRYELIWRMNRWRTPQRSSRTSSAPN